MHDRTWTLGGQGTWLGEQIITCEEIRILRLFWIYPFFGHNIYQNFDNDPMNPFQGDLTLIEDS